MHVRPSHPRSHTKVSQKSTEKLERFHIWVRALRKFLRKGIETVLVSGHFLHQTEEALGLQSQFPPLHPQADSLDRVHT